MKKTIRLQFTVFPEYAEKIKRANTDPFDSESTYIMKLIDRELASLSAKTPEETPTKPQQTLERESIKPQQTQKTPAKTSTGPFINPTLDELIAQVSDEDEDY